MKIGEPRGIVAHPSLDPCADRFRGNATYPCLEMMGDADPDVDRTVGTTEPETALEQVGHGQRASDRLRSSPITSGRSDLALWGRIGLCSALRDRMTGNSASQADGPGPIGMPVISV